ncbi:MAG: sulfotransferase [Pseudomonadales bacterium]|nr:sulfotransferase [Gammaproteobacteria bacterium]MBP6053498.1 sulfotransferase [Pseudomonadales bacterium]MBK6584607.1 sulfotransferase [Gammaproteobacteria bacterium]MBK7519884.1 sulfotransferase [Gammaproteobacteria bacterium]MBK8306388.1 sulfotransferase [Gammaproteobacteria bacterium]
MEAVNNRQFFERALGLMRSGNATGAAALCRERLARDPDDVDLLTLLGAALIAGRQPQEALDPLTRAVRLAPDFARAREHLGQALLQMRRMDEALEHLQRAAELDPHSESARRKLAHALAVAGRGEEADRLFEQDIERNPERRRLLEAGEHLRAARYRECEAVCREILGCNPDEVNALRMLARIAGEAGQHAEAERLLRRALALAPGFDDARLDLVRVLKQLDRIDEAVDCAAQLIGRNPRHALAHYLHASMLAIAARHEEAITAYRESIRLRPDNPTAQVGLGHLLKTLGRQEEGIAAYREAMRLQPDFAEVYWSLANLKTFRFSAAEVADMERRLAQESLDDDARVHFMFTLGKAHEDVREFDRAFEYYDKACRTQRMRIAYDPVDTEVMHQRIRKVFNPQLLAGAPAVPAAADTVPIFIVGLPRSGSTLIEQILASHSQVEGTAELPDLARVISEITRRYPELKYPEAVASLDAGELRALGAMYLERTRRHRSGKPFFTDKMPNNFSGIGLIRLILPQAKIIDARRHPLDSCLGSFKQHFALGQSFSYDLVELGEFYLEYRSIMRHWHEVLPGQVLEMRYEELIRDQELQTRRLLDYCGLQWEEACLRFHETERPVRTASSEQVRQPLYSSSVNHWRNFRGHLGPLIEVIGTELEGWDS